jgi:hypothetical protein
MNRFLFLLCLPVLLVAQNPGKKIRVLFLGNSYTYVNNLPQVIADLALSNNDTLVFDGNLIGGYTFQNHCTDAASLAKIAVGTWDYVVLQAQSQEPSFSPSQVNAQTLPYALRLDSLIQAANPCAMTVFYETWGRKNGDASNCPFYPPICTYTGMQNRLRDSYALFADTCKALLAPAGEAWRASVSFSPTLELYQADQSHPVLEGSYLTAAVFYEVLFQRSVLNCTYTAGLSMPLKQFLQTTAHATVTDSLMQWHIGQYVPDAKFTYSASVNTFSFNALQMANMSHVWNFGDGSNSTQALPIHQYTASGTYTVTHTVSDICKLQSQQKVLQVLLPTNLTASKMVGLQVTPNPFSNELKITLPLKYSEMSIRIVDLYGCCLAQYSEPEHVNTAQIPPGIYILRVETEEGVYLQRICKHEL